MWNFHPRIIPFWIMNYSRKQTKSIPSYARLVWCLVDGSMIMSVFWQELNSVYDEAQLGTTINDRNSSQYNPVSTLSSRISEISSGLQCSVFCHQTDCNQSTFSTDFIMSDTEPLDLSNGQRIGETLNLGYDDDRVLEDSGISYILISIIIIIISLLSVTVVIIVFIKHRTFCQHRKKSNNLQIPSHIYSLF